MKKVFGVCDLDRAYVEVLTRYISRREGSNFNVVGFSKPEALTDFIAREKFSVLLISVSFIEELSEYSASEDVVPEDTFILTEENEPGGFKFPEIYKYQSTQHILCQIKRSIDKKGGGGVARLKKTQAIGVYSPLGRCGKTSYALSKARELSNSYRTLLLTLDRYSGYDAFENDEGCAGISDLLYLSATTGVASWRELYRAKTEVNLDIIGEARCKEDILETEPDEIIRCIKDIKNTGYQKIVVDIGGLVKSPETLLAECDEIYMPCLDDEISARKIRSWEDEMRRRDKEDLLQRIIKV